MLMWCTEFIIIRRIVQYEWKKIKRSKHLTNTQHIYLSIFTMRKPCGENFEMILINLHRFDMLGYNKYVVLESLGVKGRLFISSITTRVKPQPKTSYNFFTHCCVCQKVERTFCVGLSCFLHLYYALQAKVARSHAVYKKITYLLTNRPLSGVWGTWAMLDATTYTWGAP